MLAQCFRWTVHSFYSINFLSEWEPLNFKPLPLKGSRCRWRGGLRKNQHFSYFSTPSLNWWYRFSLPLPSFSIALAPSLKHQSLECDHFRLKADRTLKKLPSKIACSRLTVESPSYLYHATSRLPYSWNALIPSRPFLSSICTQEK
jgi:hypothetical protein